MFKMFGIIRRAFSSAAADQALTGAAQLPAGELPAVVTIRDHLVGQLLRDSGDRAGPHGATRHHTAVTCHHVRHSQVTIYNTIVFLITIYLMLLKHQKLYKNISKRQLSKQSLIKNFTINFFVCLIF